MTSVARPSYVYCLRCDVCEDVRRLALAKLTKCACGLVVAKFVGTLAKPLVAWNGVGYMMRVLTNSMHAAEATVKADPNRLTPLYFTGCTLLPRTAAVLSIRTTVK